MRRAPASAAACATCTLPSTLVSTSVAGSRIETGTEACAARWKTTSGCASARIARVASRSRMSPRCSRTPSGDGSPAAAGGGEREAADAPAVGREPPCEVAADEARRSGDERAPLPSSAHVCSICPNDARRPRIRARAGRSIPCGLASRRYSALCRHAHDADRIGRRGAAQDQRDASMLDDPVLRDRVDPSGFWRLIADLPQQARAACALGRSWPLPEGFTRPGARRGPRHGRLGDRRRCRRDCRLAARLDAGRGRARLRRAFGRRGPRCSSPAPSPVTRRR